MFITVTTIAEQEYGFCQSFLDKVKTPFVFQSFLNKTIMCERFFSSVAFSTKKECANAFSFPKLSQQIQVNKARMCELIFFSEASFLNKARMCELVFFSEAITTK